MLITGGVQRTFIASATGKKRTFSMANQRFACRLDIELCSGVFYGLRDRVIVIFTPNLMSTDGQKMTY